MSPDPYAAFDEFLKIVDTNDPTAPIDEQKIGDLIAAFLLNPERHREHVNVMLEAASMTGALKMLRPLLTIYDTPPMSWASKLMPRRNRPREVMRRERQEFVSKIQGLADKLRQTVQIGDLKIDLLPVRAIETDESWKAVQKQLVVFQARTSIRPQSEIAVSRSAFALEFESSHPLHIVEATPETEFEVLGDREVTTSSSGKFAKSDQSSVESGGGASVLGFKSNVKFVASTTKSAEYAQSVSATLKDRPTMPRVICDAVGSTARWDLYATDTYSPVGNTAYEVYALVDRRSRMVTANASLITTFASWGPIEARTTKKLDLVFNE